MQAEKFLVIGSDKKMQACRSRLTDLGFDASCCDGDTLKQTLPFYCNIILPIPTLANGVISGTGISVSELCEKLSEMSTRSKPPCSDTADAAEQFASRFNQTE